MPTPLPTRARWQPLRAGIVNCLLYDDEEFWFRDGRLLLRGNNGTGKSKVMALTLPFLLDADLSASRVEPDADPDKRMEWNLLLGGRYEERLGYIWLEFGRLNEAGEAVFCTLGCGMKAVTHRGIASRWFFVTSARPRRDLSLVTEAGTTLSRDRLIDVLAGRGSVYERADEYRRAVDDALFGLGYERYRALIDLLIRLRQPQLTKRPDQEKLSMALSLALAPVDQAVLSELADAFRDLEQQRAEVHALEEIRDHLERFLGGYRRYTAVAARRLGQNLRTMHSAYEETQRELARVRSELERCQADERRAAERKGEAQHQLAEARARAGELRERPEVRELEAAERAARDASDDLARASERVERAERELSELQSTWHDAQAAIVAGQVRQAEVAELATRHGGAAGVSASFALVLAALPAATDAAGIRRLEMRAVELARERQRSIAYLQQLADATAALTRRVELARTRVHDLVAERDHAAEAVSASERAHATAAAALLARWRTFAHSLRELQLPAFDALIELMSVWTDALDGEDPCAGALTAQAQLANDRLSELRAQARATLEARESERAALTVELDALKQGRQAAPPAPYTRGPDARTSLPGAPFWQLVDFVDEFGDAERAGLEAALEASGILDAWVTLDGSVLAPDTHDVVLVAGAAREGNLGRALLPADDTRAVPRTTVESLLATIGLGERAAGETWVDLDGRWRIGPLEGLWSKSAAEFIGYAARESARRRRIAELERQVALAESAVRDALAELQVVQDRQRGVRQELAGAPSSEAVRRALQDLAAAHSLLNTVDERLVRQEAVLRDVVAEERNAIEALESSARDLGLPSDRVSLEAIKDAVADFRAALGSLWAEALAQVDRTRAAARARDALDRAQVTLADLHRDTDRAERTAQEANGRWGALRDSIGATVAEIHVLLAAANQQVGTLEAEIARLDEQLKDLLLRVGGAGGQLGQLERRLEECLAARATAVDNLQRFAASGLLAIAVEGLEVPPAPWAPDPAVRLARRVEQQLSATDASEGAWDRLSREMGAHIKELQDAVGAQGHQALIESVQGCLVVSVVYHGQQRAPDAMARQVTEEFDHRERLLNARERQLLEEHLVSEVASHLQELIADTEALVQHMNDELERRPTSTGMRLRLVWRARSDGPPGLPEARARLLRQVSDAWSQEDREAMSTFLRQQIEMVRAANDSGTWHEHLSAAFDYRQWHQFAIERWQDGRWRPATGPASSGERVLTVTLPLFAAASAHYGSARGDAPRLIMLDEAFAGVDDDSRAKSMGLLTTFDLDFLMTSEREWGCYPTIKGLAIHQLTRREGIDAVHISRWEWDGNGLSEARLDHAGVNNGAATNGRAFEFVLPSSASQADTDGCLMAGG
jgi:uncharacterized protein (TIGR02680 family)